MRLSVESARTVRDPGAAMTLAQSAILAPIALAIADVIIAGIGRIAQLLRRA